MKHNQKNYFVVIPAAVRFDKNLPPNAKLLYGDIWALCNKEGYCWATNQYFAELYGASKSAISSWLSILKDNEYINILDKNNKRIISVLSKGVRNLNTPSEILMPPTDFLNTPSDFLNHNNTYNNTINNTINKKKESYDEILAPIRETELKNLYYEYIKMRKYIRAPLTNEGLRLLMERVDSFAVTVDEKKEILKNAIVKNLKTVYPIDRKNDRKASDKERNKYSDVMEKMRNKRRNFNGNKLGEKTYQP